MLRRSFLSLAAAPAFVALRFPTFVADRVERMFPTPGKHPNGLQATSSGLWIYDQGSNRAALVDWSGKVLREFDTKTDKGSGITFDGEALWIASTYDRRIVRVDAKTGATLQDFPSPGSGVVKWGPRGPNPQPTGAHGLEWRVAKGQAELWVSNPPSATIYVLDPATGKPRRSFPSPGVRPHGIGWDPDGSLWCAESIYRSFFKMHPDDGRVLQQIMLPLSGPEVDGQIIVPHGMTVWQRHIWFCVAETAEVYRLPLA